MKLTIEDLRRLRSLAESRGMPKRKNNKEENERLSEPLLVIPVLALICENPGITTAKLIAAIKCMVKIPEDDLKPLPSRSDARFSQLVRNLKSHNTLERWGYAQAVTPLQSKSGQDLSSHWYPTEKAKELIIYLKRETGLPI